MECHVCSGVPDVMEITLHVDTCKTIDQKLHNIDVKPCKTASSKESVIYRAWNPIRSELYTSNAFYNMSRLIARGETFHNVPIIQYFLQMIHKSPVNKAHQRPKTKVEYIAAYQLSAAWLHFVFLVFFTPTIQLVTLPVLALQWWWCALCTVYMV